MISIVQGAAEWDEDRDAFVTAIAELLAAGPHAGPLTQPQAVLAARDRVVGEVRTLVAVLSRTGPDPEPVTLHDLAERPAVALAGALRLLATPAAFQHVAPSDPPPPTVTAYERRWQDAARRAALLEQHVNTLRYLPPDAAAHVLTQLADVAAALIPLDTDLARVCQAIPDPPARAYLPALTDRTGHTAVRLCATGVRLRTAAPPGHAEQQQKPARHLEPARAPRRDDPPARRQTQPGPVLLNDLGPAMTVVADALTRQGPCLSVAELRAVAALCETGAAHAATVLRHAAPAVPTARDLVNALLPLVDAASGLRRVSVRSLAPPRAELPARCGELRRQLSRLAAVATRLPHATTAELHRLAAPALDWVKQVQPVTDALTTAVQTSLNAGLLAVPTELPTRHGPALLWAPASSRSDPPRVLIRAHELQDSARPVTHLATLNPPGAGTSALQIAARTAGTAHTSLIHALAARADDHGHIACDPLLQFPPSHARALRLGPK